MGDGLLVKLKILKPEAEAKFTKMVNDIEDRMSKASSKS